MVQIDLSPKDFKEVWSTLEDLACLCYEEGEYKDGDELLRLALKFQDVAGYPDSEIKKSRMRLIDEIPFEE